MLWGLIKKKPKPHWNIIFAKAGTYRLWETTKVFVCTLYYSKDLDEYKIVPSGQVPYKYDHLSPYIQCMHEQVKHINLIHMEKTTKDVLKREIAHYEALANGNGNNQKKTAQELHRYLVNLYKEINEQNG